MPVFKGLPRPIQITSALNCPGRCCRPYAHSHLCWAWTTQLPNWGFLVPWRLTMFEVLGPNDFPQVLSAIWRNTRNEYLRGGLGVLFLFFFGGVVECRYYLWWIWPTDYNTINYVTATIQTQGQTGPTFKFTEGEHLEETVTMSKPNDFSLCSESLTH